MSKTSKEDVLVNTPIEETVAKTAEVLYGADGVASTYSSVADSSDADFSAGTDSSVADASVAEKIQGRNMQTSTIVDVEGATIPSEDTSSFKVKSRFSVNGDIIDPSTSKSILADKMVNEAHQFQTSRSAVNSFPATGTEYLKTLDFKVNP